MITAADMIEWAEQFGDSASDGFKAEILLLAARANTTSNTFIEQLSFETPEWGAFAASLFPDLYEMPHHDAYEIAPNGYDFLQKNACWVFAGFRPPQPLSFDGSEDHNLICHKIIWESRFLQDPVSIESEYALTALAAGLASQDDDAHMKSVLAMKLCSLETPLERTLQLLQQDPSGITPETYHPMLIALLVNTLEAG